MSFLEYIMHCFVTWALEIVIFIAKSASCCRSNVYIINTTNFLDKNMITKVAGIEVLASWKLPCLTTGTIWHILANIMCIVFNQVHMHLSRRNQPCCVQNFQSFTLIFFLVIAKKLKKWPASGTSPVGWLCFLILQLLIWDYFQK